MVRETRHLWIGNLPDNIREERILEHFKRYGKVQSVKILAKKDEDTPTVAATVAFIDIRSAAKAHNADNKIDERTLKTDYYEPPVSSAASSATCIYIHEKDDALGRPGAPPYTTPRTPRYPHCVPEERSYERPSHYYDRLGEREPYIRRTVGIGYHDDESYQARGRTRDRYSRAAPGTIYPEGTDRNQGHFPRSHTQRQHFEQQRYPPLDQYGDEREVAPAGTGRLPRRSTITTSSISSTVDSPPHSQVGSRQRRQGTSRRSSHSRSGSPSNFRSQSSSRSSSDSRSSSSSSKLRSSSSDSSSRSPSPSKSQSPATSYGSQGSGKTVRSDWLNSTVTAVSSLFLPPAVTNLNSNNLSLGNQCSNQPQNCASSPINNHSDREERRPLAICVRNLPVRSTDTSLKDGLFHEYKKHGKVTIVKVIGQGTDRYAVVCFKKPDDVEKALEVSKDKLFFGCKIEVTAHEGLDGEDNEFRPLEAELDEYHPKATRTLFIGNLEKDITHLDLRKHFEQFGEIIEIDIKKQGATSTSSYAFIQFMDISSVVKAMRKLDGENLFGASRIKLGFGKSMPTCCVWIDGVVESVPEKFLRRHFGRYGPVRNTVIDREKGQALVFYDSIDIAQNAVAEMRGRMLGNKRLQVDFASRECQASFCDKLGPPGLEVLPGDRQWERRERREFDPLRDEQYGRDGRLGFDGRVYSRFEGQQRPIRGNFRGMSRGGYNNCGRGQPFSGRNFDEEYSQGSGASIEDSYEQELREYGYSQRERREYGSDEYTIQGQNYSPLHRRDTNSISPSREKHRDDRSTSPLARSERSSTRGSSKTADDYHSRFGGKEEGSEDAVNMEDKETTVKQERKRSKQGNCASDLESHQSQSPPHSRQHSGSRSPSKERKSSKTWDRLNNRLKCPSSATLNSSSRDSVSNQETTGFVNKETYSEQRNSQKQKLEEKTFDFQDSVTISLPLAITEASYDSLNKPRTKSETEHLRKRVHSNDSVEEHSKSDLLGQAERKRRLLSVGSLPLSRETLFPKNLSREEIKTKMVNSNVSDSSSVKCKKTESNVECNIRTNLNDLSESVSEPLSMNHVEKQSSSDHANLKDLQQKHVHILHLLEQLQEKGSSSDTESSIDNGQLSKVQPNSEISIPGVVECTRICFKDSSSATSVNKSLNNNDKVNLSKELAGSGCTQTTESNELSETTKTLASQKPVDPRRSAEHHNVSSTSSLSALRRVRKQSVYQMESSLDHGQKKFPGLQIKSFACVEGEVGSSIDSSASPLLRLQSKLKEDEVSSSSDNTTTVRHSSSVLSDLTKTLSPRLQSISDNVAFVTNESKREIVPLCLPLPKFAASLRSPKTSPNPLTSPKTTVSSPKSGHSSSLALASKVLTPHILREPIPKPMQLGSPEPIKEIEERLKSENLSSSLIVSKASVNNVSGRMTVVMSTDGHHKIEKNMESASDSECSPISSPSCIEERIKALDEKFTAWSGSTTNKSLTTTTAASTEISTTPVIDYQKYNIKKRPKFDYMAPKPSEIMKTLLAKPTIFDQDLKRLEHINEKYEPKEIKLDLSPKVKPFFRTKAAAKEFSSPIQPLTNVTNAIGQGSLDMNKLTVSSSIVTTTTLSPPLTPPTTGSTTTITTTTVSQILVVNHITQSSSYQTIPFSPLTPGSAKIPVSSPLKNSSDNGLSQTKLNSVNQHVVSFQQRSSNPHSPSFIKKEPSTSPPTISSLPTVKGSLSLICSSQSHLVSLIPIATVGTKKEHFLPQSIKKESTEPKEASYKTHDNAIKDIPIKQENSQEDKFREHSVQKEIIKKEPLLFKEIHTFKKESLSSNPKDQLIHWKDSCGIIEGIKKEQLQDRFDMEINSVGQINDSIKKTPFSTNWESDSAKQSKVTSEIKTDNRDAQSHQSQLKDKMNEPESKRLKTHHTSSSKNTDRGEDKCSSPPHNGSGKTDKKDKSSKSSDKVKSLTSKPEFQVSPSEKEETKYKAETVKIKSEKRNKLKDNKDGLKHEGKLRTKSGDKGSERNHGKNSQSTSSKAKKEQTEKEKLKSERKSSVNCEKGQSGKSKIEMEGEEAPVYFSMYDKVKARSSHNQSLKDQATLESMRKKFNQLKKSRAKKGEKSKSGDIDSDKDSDVFSHFSSDPETKPKPCGKIKQSKKRKLVIESSSDEEITQNAFHFETSRDTKYAENSSELLSDSDDQVHKDLGSSKTLPISVTSKRKKKKDFFEVEASNSQIELSPPHPIHKDKRNKPKTKQTSTKSTRSQALKSELETTDDERTIKPKLKKKDYKKKRSKKNKLCEIKSDTDFSDKEFSPFMKKGKEGKNRYIELKLDSESSDKEVFFPDLTQKSETKDKGKIPGLDTDSDFSVTDMSHLSQAKEKTNKQFYDLKSDSDFSDSLTGLKVQKQKENIKEKPKSENIGDSDPPSLFVAEPKLDTKISIKEDSNLKKDSKLTEDDKDKKQRTSAKKKKKSRKSSKAKEKKTNTVKGICDKPKKVDDKAKENIDNSSKTDIIEKHENSLSEPAESPPRLRPSIFSDAEIRSDFSDYDFENQLVRNFSEQDSWRSNDLKNDFEKGIKNTSLSKNNVFSGKLNAEEKTIEEEDNGPPPLLENVDYEQRETNNLEKDGINEVNLNNAGETNKHLEEDTTFHLEIQTKVVTSEDFLKRKKNLKGKIVIDEKHNSKDEKRKKRNKKQTKEKKKRLKEDICKVKEITVTQLTTFPSSSQVEHFHRLDEDSKLSGDEKLDDEIVKEARKLEEELLADSHADSEETYCFESDGLPRQEEKHQERKFEEEAAKETQRLEQELFSTESWNLKVSKPFGEECLNSVGLSGDAVKDSKASDVESVKDDDIYSDLDMNPSCVRYPETPNVTLQSEEQADMKHEKTGVAEELDKQQKMEDDLAVSALLQAMNGDELPAPELQKDTEYLDSLLEPHPEHTFNYLFQDSGSSGHVRSSEPISGTQEDTSEEKDDNDSHLFTEHIPTYSQDLTASDAPTMNSTGKICDQKSPRSGIEEEDETKASQVQPVNKNNKECELQERVEDEFLLPESSLSEKHDFEQADEQVPQKSDESLFETLESSFQILHSDDMELKLSPQPPISIVHDAELDVEQPAKSEINEVIENSSQECIHPEPSQPSEVSSVTQNESKLPKKTGTISKIELKKPRHRKKKGQNNQLREDANEEMNQQPSIKCENKEEQEGINSNLDMNKSHGTFSTCSEVESEQLYNSEKKYINQQEVFNDFTKGKETTVSGEAESHIPEIQSQEIITPEVLNNEWKNNDSDEGHTIVNIVRKDCTSQPENLGNADTLPTVEASKFSFSEQSKTDEHYIPSTSEFSEDAELGICQLDSIEREHKDQIAEQHTEQTLVDEGHEGMTEGEDTEPSQGNVLPSTVDPKPKKIVERQRRGRKPKTRKYAESSLFLPNYETKDIQHVQPAILTRSGGRRRRPSTADKNRRTLRSDTTGSLMSTEVPTHTFADTEDSLDDQISKLISKSVVKVAANKNDDLVLNSEVRSNNDECIIRTDVNFPQDHNNDSAIPEICQEGIEKLSEINSMEEMGENIKQEEPKKRRGRKKKGSTDHQLPTSSILEKPDIKCGETENRSKEPRLLLSLSALEKSPDQKPQKESGNAYDVFEFRDSEDEEITFEKDIQNSFKERMLETNRTVPHSHDYKQHESEKEKKAEDIKHKAPHHEEKDMSCKEYVTELSQHGKIAITIRLHQKDGHDGSSAGTAEVVKTSQAICSEEVKLPSYSTEKPKEELSSSLTSDAFLTGPCKSTRKAIQLQSQITKTSVDDVIEEVVKGHFKNAESPEADTDTLGGSQRITRRTRARCRSEEVFAKAEEMEHDFETSNIKHEPMFIIPDNIVKDHPSESLKVPISHAIITSIADSSSSCSEPDSSRPETRMLLRSYRITRSTSRLESSSERSVSPRSSSDQLPEPLISQVENKSVSTSIVTSSVVSNDNGHSLTPLPVLKVELPQLSSTLATQIVTSTLKDSKTTEKKTESSLSTLEKDDDTDSRSSPTVLIDPVTGFLTPVNKKGEPTGVIRETPEISEGTIVTSLIEHRLNGNKSNVVTSNAFSNTTGTKIEVVSSTEQIDLTRYTSGCVVTYTQNLKPSVVEYKNKKEDKFSSAQLIASNIQETVTENSESLNNSVNSMPQSLELESDDTVSTKHSTFISTAMTSVMPVSVQTITAVTGPVTSTLSVSSKHTGILSPNTSEKDLPVGQPLVPIAQPMPGLPSTAASPYTPTLSVSASHSHRSLKPSITSIYGPQTPLPSHQSVVKTVAPTAHQTAETVVATPVTPVVHPRISVKSEIKGLGQPPVLLAVSKESATIAGTGKSGHPYPPKHSPTYFHQPGFPMGPHETAVHPGPSVLVSTSSGGVIAELLQNPQLLQQRKEYLAAQHSVSASVTQMSERLISHVSRTSGPGGGPIHADIAVRLGNPTPPQTPTPPVTSSTHSLQAQELHSAHLAQGLHLRHPNQAPLIMAPPPPLGIHPSDLPAYVHMYAASHPHYAALHPEIRVQQEAQARAAAAMGITQRFGYPPIPAAAGFRQPIDTLMAHTALSETKPEGKSSQRTEDKSLPQKTTKVKLELKTPSCDNRPRDDHEHHQPHSSAECTSQHVMTPGHLVVAGIQPAGHYSPVVRQLSPHISIPQQERATDSPAVASPYASGQVRHPPPPHLSGSRMEEHKPTDSTSRLIQLPKSETEKEMKPPAAHQNPPTTIPYHTLELRGAPGRPVPAIGAPAPGHLEGRPVHDRAYTPGALSLKRDVPTYTREQHFVPGELHPTSDSHKKMQTHLRPYVHQGPPTSPGPLSLSTTSSVSSGISVLSPRGRVQSPRPQSASSISGESICSRRGSVHLMPQTGSEAPVSVPPPAHAMSQHTGIPRAQPQTPPHDSQVPPQGDSLLLQRYPVMWQGLLALKNDQAAVQMHFVSGNPLIARASLPPMTEGGTPPVRIAQRMRLEQNQLEGVARKMQMLEEHCILLALPCGRDHMDVLQQSNNLRNGFINYLQLKQAAGIVNAAAPGSQQPAYVIHIFPSCDFSNENMARIAPDLLHSVSDIAHLLIIIATV
ncbi:protein split ends-like isoform X2 [Limulus polyphemus]|uniref:Protein split ends-like isoform X2 n=1 Tax=Limulus polyphemus TaxID=6850 RepID=A0ABM1SVF4_LIMPO|nr:protein split ends-like isoform X2 [Limulus polyphemus]